MASLRIGHLEEETLRRLKARAKRDSLSLEETVRCTLRMAVMDDVPLGATIRRIAGKDAFDLELPQRELHSPIDFASDEYGTDRI